MKEAIGTILEKMGEIDYEVINQQGTPGDLEFEFLEILKKLPIPLVGGVKPVSDGMKV